MKLIHLLAPLALTALVACASDPKVHFSLRELDLKQQQDFAAANIILLGEQHDNPFHHQIQADVIDKLGRDGRLKAVVLEQIEWTNQGVLDQLSTSNLRKLPQQLAWDTSGWPDYELYRPVIEGAVRHRAKVIAGGLPKDRLAILSKIGYEGAFTASEIERLHLRSELNPQAKALLAKEIFEGHCKMIPEDHVAKMIPIQRARDAAMIRGYQNEAPRDGVTVFILGAGHARKEFGVPSLLRITSPNAKVWSMGMQERGEGKEEGGEAFPEGAFDKVWVTEKWNRPDPCESMKKHIEKNQEPER